MHARTALRRRTWIAGAVVGAGVTALATPLLGGAVLTGAAAFFIGMAMRPGSDFYLRQIRRGGAASRRVALTFDDGPDPVRTPQVLDVLDEAGARATFFMIGRRVAEAPRIVSRAVAAGHEIGAHSFSHERTLPFRPRARHREELRASIEALHGAEAPAPRWYRPPMGYATPGLAAALEGSGLGTVHWSVHSRDLADPDPERIAARVLRDVRGGDIVLLHDGSDRHGSGPEAVPAALRIILRGLRERGLSAVTVSELVDAEGEAP